MSFEWTSENLATIRKMFGEGASFLQIADAIGTTRSAVAGKINRLGLGRRISAEQLKAKRAEAARKRAAYRYQKPAWFAEKDSPPVAPPPGRYAGANRGGARPATVPPQAAPAVVEPIAIPPAGGITLVEVRDGLCRWPISKETTFDQYRACGCPCAMTRPYCIEHTKASTAPREDRKRDEKAIRQAQANVRRAFA